MLLFHCCLFLVATDACMRAFSFTCAVLFFSDYGGNVCNCLTGWLVLGGLKENACIFSLTMQNHDNDKYDSNHPSTQPSPYSSDCPAHLSISLSVSLSIYLSIYLFIYPSIHLVILFIILLVIYR